MKSYRVSFFKNLLSSNGHPFKCLQKAVEIRHARSRERAVRAAKQRYARFHHAPHWALHADSFEVEVDGRKIDYRPAHANQDDAKYPSWSCGKPGFQLHRM